MKPILSAALSALMVFSAGAQTGDRKIIRIATDNTDLVLEVGPNNRLYQTYLGPKLRHNEDLINLTWNQHAGSDGSVSTRGWEAYSTSGNEDFFEPALGITHSDGNMTTYLYYENSTQEEVPGGTHTKINLRDDKYPVNVTLNYVAYPKENVIKTWSEISHREKKPISLSQYASAMLYFNEPEYWLTEFSSDWAKEAQMRTQQLQFGKKVIDTKLGSRAAMHTHPFFEIGLNGPAKENSGEVLMGTLGWTGNFRFTFEVDNVGNLRVIPGINPYASTYELKANEVFTTPEFIFTISYDGTSQGSRNLHDWARKYQLKDGEGQRLTLLNNWENTAFDFDQDILAKLMKEAKHLGVDMFLLDDGWFGNKYPRKDDHAGLG
ncbi:MAG: alpha-galactosidase, partial [Muribaculaceae bacterium]|nr:alpha-galactosidase [Muribaculaceae bacterium]